MLRRPAPQSNFWRRPEGDIRDARKAVILNDKRSLTRPVPAATLSDRAINPHASSVWPLARSNLGRKCHQFFGGLLIAGCCVVCAVGEIIQLFC